jgi:hypothetical protein
MHSLSHSLSLTSPTHSLSHTSPTLPGISPAAYSNGRYRAVTMAILLWRTPRQPCNWRSSRSRKACTLTCGKGAAAGRVQCRA